MGGTTALLLLPPPTPLLLPAEEENENAEPACDECALDMQCPRRFSEQCAASYLYTCQVQTLDETDYASGLGWFFVLFALHT
jgi:hypothetical protein